MLLKGIMEQIQNNTDICKSKPIRLPWKNELAVTTTSTTDVTTEETKTLDRQTINSQEHSSSVTNYVKESNTSRRSSKSQRNCPKIKNEDYIWK